MKQSWLKSSPRVGIDHQLLPEEGGDGRCPPVKSKPICSP